MRATGPAETAAARLIVAAAPRIRESILIWFSKGAWHLPGKQSGRSAKVSATARLFLNEQVFILVALNSRFVMHDPPRKPSSTVSDFVKAVRLLDDLTRNDALIVQRAALAAKRRSQSAGVFG